MIRFYRQDEGCRTFIFVNIFLFINNSYKICCFAFRTNQNFSIIVPCCPVIRPQPMEYITGSLILKEMEGTRREDIKPGAAVMVELTEDKRTGKLTGGRVLEILTSAPIHPHGIKVKLDNGLIGRVKQIITI
jgi:uncharacterized repeat protein (TIGR03833 family)